MAGNTRIPHCFQRLREVIKEEKSSIKEWQGKKAHEREQWVRGKREQQGETWEKPEEYRNEDRKAEVNRGQQAVPGLALFDLKAPHLCWNTQVYPNTSDVNAVTKGKMAWKEFGSLMPRGSFLLYAQRKRVPLPAFLDFRETPPSTPQFSRSTLTSTSRYSLTAGLSFQDSTSAPAYKIHSPGKPEPSLPQLPGDATQTRGEQAACPSLGSVLSVYSFCISSYGLIH